MAYLLAAIIYCVVMGLPSLVLYVMGSGGASIFEIFPRLLRYFREGEPLIPQGLRESRIFGYWFGMLLVYIGHLGLLVLGFLVITEGSKTGASIGLVIGIGLIPIMIVYGLGIAMVESSYSLWAEQIALPYERYQRKQAGKPKEDDSWFSESDSLKTRALKLGVIVAGVALYFGARFLLDERVSSQRWRESATAETLTEAGPAMTYIEEYWRQHGRQLCPGDPAMEQMPIPRVKGGQRWVELTGCGELYVRAHARGGYGHVLLQAIDTGDSDLGWGCVSASFEEMSREGGQRCRFDPDARPGEGWVTEATLVRYEEELNYRPGVGLVTWAESRITVDLADFLPLGGTGWQGTLGYRDYQTNRWVEIPAELEVELTSGDTVSLAYYPDEPGKGFTHPLRLERQGAELDDLEVVDRTERPGGILRVIARGPGEDDGRDVTVRMTYLIGESTLTIRKDIEQAGGKLMKRNEYRFERPVEASD